jgi:hypothetical protein
MHQLVAYIVEGFSHLGKTNFSSRFSKYFPGQIRSGSETIDSGHAKLPQRKSQVVAINNFALHQRCKMVSDLSVKWQIELTSSLLSELRVSIEKHSKKHRLARQRPRRHQNLTTLSMEVDRDEF